MDNSDSSLEVEVQVLDTYENIKNRCMLADFLNESASGILDDANDSSELFPAMLLLRVIRIKAELNRDGKMEFTPLASIKLDGVLVNFDIIDYSADSENDPWIIGEAALDNNLLTAKIAVKKEPHRTHLVLKEKT